MSTDPRQAASARTSGGPHGARAAGPTRAGAASRLPAATSTGTGPRLGWPAARSVTSRRGRPRREPAPGRGTRATPARRRFRRRRPPWPPAAAGRPPEGERPGQPGPGHGEHEVRRQRRPHKRPDQTGHVPRPGPASVRPSVGAAPRPRAGLREQVGKKLLVVGRRSATKCASTPARSPPVSRSFRIRCGDGDAAHPLGVGGEAVGVGPACRLAPQRALLVQPGQGRHHRRVGEVFPERRRAPAPASAGRRPRRGRRGSRVRARRAGDVHPATDLDGPTCASPLLLQ